MPPRKIKSNLDKFESINSEIEDEILDEYSELTGDEDLYLNQLPELLTILKIPTCFTNDITNSIEYYYSFVQGRGEEVNPSNIKQSTSLQLIQAYTITNNIQDIIDIIDIDKLLFNLNRLIKFRNNYQHIQNSWKLFLQASGSVNTNTGTVDTFKLTLPDLKQVKSSLDLDNDPETKKPISESFLIDMLGCCCFDSNGNLLNYNIKEGACVDIKDFAEILGNLGELD
ncbi:hypothetical protein JA1_001440 [Spathaspora sp. JA1]|nr:hypothetical protein JA1_001440 [Spathaspora sp. JA1]